jgi:serine/threonine-protein kinase
MTTRTVPGATGGWAVPGYSGEREIGSGASGRVVAAVSTENGQPAAIKYLSSALIDNPAFRETFRTQVQQLMKLDVPQLVRVDDYVEQPGRDGAVVSGAVVTELVNGVPLRSVIQRQGPAGPEAALAVLKSVLLALAAIHRLGFGHRDVKPGNVLVTANGEVKLTDAGVAIRAADRVAAPGTPLYLAPERWRGEPATPATDVYAATAVFFETLTGVPPFTGDLDRLQEQHLDATVPLDQVDAALAPLIVGGLAKYRESRPHSAIAFVSELEALAATAYGPDWEERGRGQLATSAAALLPGAGRVRPAGAGAAGNGPVPAGPSGAGDGRRRRRRAMVLASIAAALVVAAGATTAAVTLTGHSSQVSLSEQSSRAVTALTPSVTAVANVTPPVAASKCTAPATFTYSGTVSASKPGPVRYRWAYSSGKLGPVRTLSFPGPGHLLVAGDKVRVGSAGRGWGEIKLLSPVRQTSAKARYTLLCGGAGGLTATAAVTPATRTTDCATATPVFTATGSITATKAEKVGYYWAQSSGAESAPATLTFTGPGSQAALPLKITPQAASGSGEAVLVVTSPAAAASSPATYTLSCTAPAKSPAGGATRPGTSLALSATASVSPASRSLTSCSAAAPAFTFSGTVRDSKAGTLRYHWQLPGGAGPTRTLHFAQAGTQTVTTAYTPGSDTARGSGTLVVSGPGSATSNPAAFTLTCGAALAVTNNAPTLAQDGQAYSGTVTVSGGSGPYSWSVTGLPGGLSTNGSGPTLTISGSPAAAGTFTARVSVHDSAKPQHAGTASLTLTVAEPPLQITSYLPAGTAGQGYSTTITGSGGNGSYSWQAVSGLPGGLTATPSGNTLTISGSPEASGGFPVTVSVSDTESPAQTATASLTLTVGAPPVQITTTGLPSGTAGSGYDATADATGGGGSYTWSASGLPSGLSIDPGSGEITGTPSDSGSYQVTLSVLAGSGRGTDRASVSLTIAPAPDDSSPSSPPSTSPSSPPPHQPGPPPGQPGKPSQPPGNPHH